MKFQCQPNCGKCCKGDGTLYLTDRDAVILASHLKLSIKEFTEKYVRITSDGHKTIRRESDCPFLDGTKCTVHGFHPTQCRTFPFWPGNLMIMEQLAEKCPGFGCGPEIPESEYLPQFEEAFDILGPDWDLVGHF